MLTTIGRKIVSPVMKSLLCFIALASTCLADVTIYRFTEKGVNIGQGSEASVIVKGRSISDVATGRMVSIGQFVVSGHKLFIVLEATDFSRYHIVGNNRELDVMMRSSAITNAGKITFKTETLQGFTATLPLGNGTSTRGPRLLVGSASTVEGYYGSLQGAFSTIRATFSTSDTAKANRSSQTIEQAVQVYISQLQSGGWTEYVP